MQFHETGMNVIFSKIKGTYCSRMLRSSKALPVRGTNVWANGMQTKTNLVMKDCKYYMSVLLSRVISLCQFLLHVSDELQATLNNFGESKNSFRPINKIFPLVKRCK
jgi:hypothetical protein